MAPTGVVDSSDGACDGVGGADVDAIDSEVAIAEEEVDAANEEEVNAADEEEVAPKCLCQHSLLGVYLQLSYFDQL